MDRFYQKNADLYRTLVDAFDKSTPTAQTNRTSTVAKDQSTIVGARIRPLLDDDDSASFPCALFPRPSQGHDTRVVDAHDLYNHPRGRPILKSSKHHVDKIFDQNATTEEIYQDFVENLVSSAWNGGIGTLFAYGQTGSGKTYTVSKLEELAVMSLVDGSLQGKRDIYLSVIELAGNSAFDLLNSRKAISILEDSFGNTNLVGAEECLVREIGEVEEVLKRATSFRRTASTQKNDASSRSHGICRIRIENPAAGSGGILYLIDLAGSEAARDIAVHGADRMRETREINMSLSVLKDCIRAKADADAAIASGDPKVKLKKPRIPFRQSALTRVLKHVFEPSEIRECKTVVIACVNPSLADVGSSKNTLRFAELLLPKGGATPKRVDATASTTKVNRKYSSRQITSGNAEVPFKQRICPGMVISWNENGRDGDADAFRDTKLAMILCPTEAAKIVDLGSTSTDEQEHQYLCGAVVPGQKTWTYELNPWDQTVINTAQMLDEVILEYEPENRCYRNAT